MRAFFVIHELALNGAATALLHQVRRMCARGDRVTVATPALNGPAAALAADFTAAGAELTHVFDWTGHDIVIGCTVFTATVMRGCVGHVPTAWWIHEGRAGVSELAGKTQALQTLQALQGRGPGLASCSWCSSSAPHWRAAACARARRATCT